MAKIVIAGVANCPYFARLELLADKLAFNLPHFQVHKILKLPDEWPSWLEEVCMTRGWTHDKSPIVWRELIDRGGKGTLIGGPSEFQEYVAGYYDLKSDLEGDDLARIAEENLRVTAELFEETKERNARIKPLKICITNASSQTCYGLIGSLARGDTLGLDTDISLHLLDSEDNQLALHGMEMEARDVAGKVLRDVVTTADPEAALSDCAFVVLADELDRQVDESKEEFLRRAHDHYAKYVAAIEKVAKEDVRVVIMSAGNCPANFVAASMLRCANRLDSNQIVASSQLVENHAKGVLAGRLKINRLGVENVVVWGNVGGTRVIDTSVARLYDYDGAVWGQRPFFLPLQEILADSAWLNSEFVRLVDRRSEAVRGLLGHSAAASVSDAISTLIRLWWHGSTSPEEIYSLGVASQGWYGVPEGVVFSFPVKFAAGQFAVCSDIVLTEDVRAKIPEMIEELYCEIEAVYPNPARVRWQKKSRKKPRGAKVNKKQPAADDEENSNVESNEQNTKEE